MLEDSLNRESICDADKRYFELNPDKRELRRPFYPRECTLEGLARFEKSLGRYPDHVVVRRKANDLRSRTCMVSHNKAIGMAWDADTEDANKILESAAYKIKAHNKKAADKRKAKRIVKQAERSRKRNWSR